MIHLRIAIFAALLVQSLFVKAQPRMHAYNTNAWLMYFGNHKVSERVGLHAEVQWRRSDTFSKSQQLLLRTGLDYYLKPDIRFTLGYAFIETYPYGDFAVPNAFPEHRIWQQLFLQQNLGKIKLSHRYRLEQRMIGNASTGKFENGRFENRVRYMAKATVNISNGSHPVFAALYDEVFINFGKDVGYNIFDQNRLYGALGYSISETFKVEVGYLYQIILLRNLDGTSLKNRIENNTTLQVGLFSNLSFVKKN